MFILDPRKSNGVTTWRSSVLSAAITDCHCQKLQDRAGFSSCLKVNSVWTYESVVFLPGRRENAISATVLA
jgi:hypothetical protein